jgi:hypothetical protein
MKRTPLLLLVLAAMPIRAGDAPADLRLQWVGPPAAVRGPAGSTMELRFQIRNVGGKDAFATIVKAHTTLGPLNAPARVQPGPRAGALVERKLAVALADGMREICVEASLQNRSDGDPPDPNPVDNRICRPVNVAPEAK